MSNQAPENLNLVLENIGGGVLIFNQRNALVYDNAAARRLLGANLVLVRTEGWSAFEMLINAHPGEYKSAQEIRNKAQRSEDPIRFSMLLGGSFNPCWMSSYEDSGTTFTQIIIDNPDWSALTELMSTFRAESSAAINDTNGHADFLRKLMKNPPAKLTAAQLGERGMGMLDLISTKMYRLQLLVDMLHRLEIIRTGQLADAITRGAKKLGLEDFLEDFLEELNEQALIDPSASPQEYRERLKLDMPDRLHITTPPYYLRHILRDLLRNAFLYSEPETTVTLRVTSASQGRNVEFNVIDEGCGIRAKETDRIFEPFQRARQPHVMREHGYGLSLYLVKEEISALGGRIWFESEEGVGSTFSFKLPVELS